MHLPTLWYSIPGASPTALLAPRRVRQLAAMRDAGIHAFEINYPIAAGWQFPGQYDFGNLDAWLHHIISIDQQARLLLRVDLHAPAFWYLLHPEDAVDYALGAPNQSSWGGDGGTDLATGIRPLRISLASQAWRRATSEALQALVLHLQKSRYAKNVVGIMTACCTYGEWHYWGFFHLPDIGPAMVRHFRRFVRRSYHGSLSAVQRAWGMELRNWDQVRPPARERMHNSPSAFRQGRYAAWTLDYVRCHHRLVADTLIGFCKTVKLASRGRLLTGAFHGYFFNTPWRDEGGHLEFKRVAKSPWVDYLAAPQIYDIHARDIGGTGLDRSLVASIRRRGKMWFSEADTPTHIGRTMRQYWKTREEIARDADDSIALVRRDAARALTQGTRLWWFDFGRHYRGGEYLHPRIMGEIRRLVRLADWAAKLDCQPIAQAAVAYDDESPYHVSHWRSGQDCVSSGVGDQLLREAQYLGAPADAVLWEDVEPRHRLVVVANAFFLEPRQRARLQAKLCRDGRVVLWMYAPGALGTDDAAAGITAVTGIRTRAMNRAAKPVIRFLGESRLIAGLKDTPFRYTAAPVWMEKDEDLRAPKHIRPAFYIADRQAETLAVWQGTDRAALASRQEPWGISVFCALPLVPRRFLHNLLLASGAHIYGADQDVWMANRSVVAVHTRHGGRRTIRLPEATDVMDGTTGRLVARRADTFSVQLRKRSTRIWLLKSGIRQNV